MKITKKKVTTVTETITYNIHPNVRIMDVIVNGKASPRQIFKHGKIVKDGDYTVDFWPIYDPDLTYLEETNPFWRHNKTKDSKWFEGNPLPDDVNDIDVSKIVFTSGYDHSFWTVDLEPIPVVFYGDYIDAGIRSGRFDLKKLHKHLSKHKQVKTISEIEMIPWYNNDGSETYFTITVLPTVKQLKELKKNKQRRGEFFYKPWNETDYLGVKKFYIGKD